MIAITVMVMMMPYSRVFQKPSTNQPRWTHVLRYVSLQVSHANCQNEYRMAASKPVPIIPMVWTRGVR